MKRQDLLIGLILLAVAVGFPFTDPPRFILTQTITLFIWATVVSQWNLVFGVAGIFSLAQVALFVVGAYITAMLSLYLGWSLWATFPIAGLGTMLFSLLVGLACLRLRGFYVALLTLAIAQGLFIVIVNDHSCFRMEGTVCRSFSGGGHGLSQYGDFGFRQLLGRDWVLGDYYTTLALLVAAMVASFVIINSRLGLAFRALRDHPELARCRGVSRFTNQMLVFALSALFTGVAGGFYAAHNVSIGPGTLDFSLLLFLIAMLVVGGIGRPWGPLVGALLLMIADEALKELEQFRIIGLGLLLLFFMLLLPDGLTGAIETGWRRLGAMLAARSAEPRSASEED